MLDNEDHLLPERSEADVLYEVLLKRGLDLCAPMQELNVKNHTVHAVGGGVLMACLSESIPQGDVEPLAEAIAKWRKKLAPETDTKVLFRDSAFANDVAKANMTAILEQRGFVDVGSL